MNRPSSLLLRAQRIRAQQEGRWVASPPTGEQAAAPKESPVAAFEFLLNQFDKEVQAAKVIQVSETEGRVAGWDRGVQAQGWVGRRGHVSLLIRLTDEPSV
jgi:hypothetical protein